MTASAVKLCEDLTILDQHLVTYGGAFNHALLAFIGRQVEKRRQHACVDKQSEATVERQRVGGKGVISTCVFAEDAKKDHAGSDFALADHGDKKITIGVEDDQSLIMAADHAHVCVSEDVLVSSATCVCFSRGRLKELDKIAEKVALEIGPRKIDENSPLFGMIADKELMENLDMLSLKNDSDDEEDSFVESLRKDILLGNVAPQEVWQDAMTKIKELTHLRVHLSLSSAGIALAENPRGVQYYVGGVSEMRKFAIEADPQTRQEMAVCLDARVPLASHGDISYDLTVFLNFACEPLSKIGENASYGAVSLYFGKVCFETAEFERVDNGYQARLLCNGVPSGAIKHMRARLACKFPISPLLDSAVVLPNFVRYRVSCVLLPRPEKEFIDSHAMVIGTKDKSWLIGNGIVAQLEKKACTDACIPHSQDPIGLRDLYDKRMYERMAKRITGRLFRTGKK